MLFHIWVSAADSWLCGCFVSEKLTPVTVEFICSSRFMSWWLICVLTIDLWPDGWLKIRLNQNPADEFWLEFWQLMHWVLPEFWSICCISISISRRKVCLSLSAEMFCIDLDLIFSCPILISTHPWFYWNG